jgi:hypothetical protein
VAIVLRSAAISLAFASRSASSKRLEPSVASLPVASSSLRAPFTSPLRAIAIARTTLSATRSRVACFSTSTLVDAVTLLASLDAESDANLLAVSSTCFAGGV